MRAAMQVCSMFVVVTAAEITPPLIYSDCNSAAWQGIQYWYSTGVTQVICSKDLQKCFALPYLLFSYSFLLYTYYNGNTALL